MSVAHQHYVIRPQVLLPHMPKNYQSRNTTRPLAIGAPLDIAGRGKRSLGITRFTSKKLGKNMHFPRTTGRLNRPLP